MADTDRNLGPEYPLAGTTDVYHSQPFRGSIPGEFGMDVAIVDGHRDLVRGTDSTVDEDAARAVQAAKLAEAGIAPDHLYDASLPQNRALSVLVQGDRL